MVLLVKNWVQATAHMNPCKILMSLVDRNNFTDLQNVFLEIKCKNVQSSEADLKYDAAATADITKTYFPYFCNNVLHSIFSDCTESANGQKLSNANGNYAHKNFIETQFSHNKDAKNT